MGWRKYVHSGVNIMMGKPVITGTRIPVELILEKIAAGATFEQILEAHPLTGDKDLDGFPRPSLCVWHCVDTAVRFDSCSQSGGGRYRSQRTCE